MKHKKYLLLLIIPLLVLLISRTFSLSYTHEIKSVEIQSNDYDSPGSWHIDKSAEWTGFGKAKVTFDVNSVMKTEDNHYKDVILVMDTSGSMDGDKLDRAKEDAIDLTNYLLSNSNNRVALITFGSTSTIKSDFTNNKTQIVDYIDNLTVAGTTNYNAGLLNIDSVMENYVQDSNKDLIVLFLTDGYPNKDTPNEKATYQMLKDKYPYMTINGIQYEMGKNLIQEIIDISDNQYIANMDTLNNVLFEATVLSTQYDNFIIEDYIYGDYFYIDSVNDIEVPFGTVTIENVSGTQKVIWNLGNNYATGRNVKMNINLKLKEAYHNTKGLYPTNQNEIIISKLPNDQEKTKSSEDTPVLLNAYNVIYETNTPDGCNLPSIQSEEHYVYQTVTKRSDVLSCSGYIFKGWYIKGSDIADIYTINDDTFLMPSHDVTIRGTWTKQDLVKMMDGTVKTKINGTLMVHDSSNTKTFGKSINRDSFESITTVDDIMIPATAIDFWDVSAEQNGSVLAWYTDTDNDSKYELYIGQEDGVKANTNSSYAFYYFRNAEIIDLTNFDTSTVTNMNSMFYYTGYNVSTFELDLTNLDTSKVTNMSYMLYSAGYTATTWNIGNLSNWDTSKVINMSNMFFTAGYNSTTWTIGNLNNWDTSTVTNMNSMFRYAGYRATTWNNGDLSTWDTSKVTNMGYMFYNACSKVTTFELDISNWDTSKVTNMSYMFYNAGYDAQTWNIGNLDNWDVSSVTDMSYMFRSAGYNATTWNIGDLSSWNTSNSTNMRYMFQYVGQHVTTWNIGDLSGWNTSKVTNMAYMFDSAGKNATTFNIGNLSNWDTSKVTNMNSMFHMLGYEATTWNIGDLSNWDTSNVTDMSGLFAWTGLNETNWSVGDLSNWDTSKATTMNSMFFYTGSSSTTWSVGDLSNWDTSKVTNMGWMFYMAGSGATTWNSIGTLKVYASTLQNMFYSCTKAKATLNIYSNPANYIDAFKGTSTNSGSGITVNYSSVTTNIDDIIATKSTNSNVVKGVQLD
ncbi:MAG: BspA family leucine-rich repeat surface protein [Bacilli bacterium]|nr:BspA family leucine-rich repeat surface protein [Bacilli bacterium]